MIRGCVVVLIVLAACLLATVKSVSCASRLSRTKGVLIDVKHRGCHKNEVCLLAPPNYIEPPLVFAPRVGVVSLMKAPLGLDTWLKHHRRSLGAVRFFLRFEDTPEVQLQLREQQDVSAVYATGVRSYHSLMVRQTQHVDESILLARAAGLTHLLHIDADELLHPPHGVARLMCHLSSSTASCISVSNLEAVFDQEDCVDPFLSTNKFRTRPSDFSAYVNGKAFGALSDPSLAAHGPHRFTGPDEQLASHIAVVLHYESPCIEMWKQKFVGYAKDAPHACARKEIPFPFYCESMAAAMRDTSNMQSVWERWKLTPRDKTGIVEFSPLARA
jgi:hypothetical protein